MEQTSWLVLLLFFPSAPLSAQNPWKVDVGGPVIIHGAGDGGKASPDYGYTLAQLKNGSLFFAGAEFSLKSNDQGRTWFVAPPLSGHLLERQDGSLYLLQARTARTDRPGVYSGKRLHLKAISDLEHRDRPTWQSASLEVDRLAVLTGDSGEEIDAPFISGPILELADGALIVGAYGNFVGDTVPIEGFVATKGEKWFKYRTYLLRSTDGGSSWEYFSTVAYDGKTGQESFSEPGLAHFGDGELLAVMRTGRYAPLYQARSLNGGKTWQKPESLHTLGLAPQLALLPNGVLVCSFGWRPMKNTSTMVGAGPYPAAAADYQKRYRDDVGIEDPSAAAGDYVMFSSDRGHSWSRPRRIAEPLTAGYTWLVAASADSCVVISKRITLPGQSTASLLEKWEHEWARWSQKRKIVLEARLVQIQPAS